MNNHERPRGFITIAAVMLLLAVSVAIALESLMTAWQSTDAQSAWDSNARARALAGACAERARSQLLSDVGYVGDETIEFGDHACSVLPIASGSYEVHAEGRARDVVARLLVVFDVSIASGSVEAIDVIRYERVAQF
jgi:hypothetical protein